jgi:hypothetical protein
VQNSVDARPHAVPLTGSVAGQPHSPVPGGTDHAPELQLTVTPSGLPQGSANQQVLPQ